MLRYTSLSGRKHDSVLGSKKKDHVMGNWVKVLALLAYDERGTLTWIAQAGLISTDLGN